MAYLNILYWKNICIFFVKEIYKNLNISLQKTLANTGSSGQGFALKARNTFQAVAQAREGVSLIRPAA